MRPRLTLYRKKDGTPDRFFLHCSYELRGVAKGAGRGTGVWRKLPRAWSYPLDPLIIRNLMEFLADLQIDKEVWDYLNVIQEKQNRIALALNDNSRLCPEDRLWPFQRASVRFLSEAKKCILGHEMGTGKTVIATKALDYLGARRTVIVCPNSVKWSWAEHYLKWANPEQDPIVLESGRVKIPPVSIPVIDGTSVADRNKKLNEFFDTNNDFTLITNYDQARIHESILSARDYDVLIMDEAHRIKNPKALRTQSLVKISNRSEYTWMCTGTPIRNNYDDLWMLLHICDPTRFTGYWNFLNLYLEYYEKFTGGIDIVGIREPNFHAVIGNYMHCKTKAEVMPDLPDKVYRRITLPLNPKQQKIYEKMEKDAIMYIQQRIDTGEEIDGILWAPEVVAQIIRLRQICLSPAIVGGTPDSAKLDALKDLLTDLQGEQAVIYTCFRRFIPFVELILQEVDISYGTIVGGQSSSDRQKVVRDLNNGSIQVIVGTIQSMGEGMNLQAASVAIFCDIDWVPAVNLQAEDRIHRGKIKKSPTIIHLYHPNTVESDIWAACMRKEKIANETVGQIETIRALLRRG